MTSPFYQYGLELRRRKHSPLLIGTAGGLAGASMGSPLTLGQWSHLAIVFNGTQARFYVNGNLVSSPSLSASISARDSLLYMAADTSAQPVLQRHARRREALRPRAEPDRSPDGHEHAAQRARVRPHRADASRSPLPPNDAVVSGNRTITADATDDVGVAGVQFFVDGTPVGPEDTAPPYAANWDTRLIPNGAHTLTARARDTDNKTTLSALVNVTVANSDYFQNQVLATGFDLPTTIEFLPGRPHAGRRAGGQDQGSAAAVHDPGSRHCSSRSPTSPRAVCSRGSTTSRSIPTSPPTTTTTSSTRWGRRTSIGCRASRPTRRSPARCRGASSSSTRIPQAAYIEHHGGAIDVRQRREALLHDRRPLPGTPSQDLNSPRGKIHRIDKDGFVPLDNPFYDGAGPELGLGLGLWSAQSVPRLLRRPHQPALHRRCRRERRAPRTRS